MADKARDAFRTISEVANWLDVPAHVLRFWESKFPQIKPVKRAGGRRYYRPADMELIGGIKKLLHDDGLTIRGVQKMIKEEGVKEISTLSPPLNMPSEEEAAARRKARRARRQARQAARGRTGEASKRLTPPAPPSPPEEEAEAPFTHVEDAELVDEQDNVVQMPGRQDEATDSPSAADLGAAEADAEALATTSLPTTPEPEPNPVVAQEPMPEEPMPEAQTSFSLDQEEATASPSDADEAPQDSAEDEPDLADETSDASPAPAAPHPAPKLDSDPVDIGAVTATEAQRMRVKRLRKFRRLDVGTVLAGGSSDAVMRAYDKLETLRERLAIDLDRR